MLLIECVIGIILFTVIVVALTLKNPMASIGDYPPEIKKRCEELKLIEPTQKRYTSKDVIRKIVAAILFSVIFAFVLYKFNGADTFLKGFVYSYIIWIVIDWYDALVIDCMWFCHSEKVKIKGTEDMEEYNDYLFHIKQSVIGMLIGIPACTLVGLLVLIF